MNYQWVTPGGNRIGGDGAITRMTVAVSDFALRVWFKRQVVLSKSCATVLTPLGWGNPPIRPPGDGRPLTDIKSKSGGILRVVSVQSQVGGYLTRLGAGPSGGGVETGDQGTKNGRLVGAGGLGI